MDRAAGPSPVAIGPKAFSVQPVGDFALRLPLHEHVIYPANRFDFLLRTGHQDHAIGLKALPSANREFALGMALVVNELATKTNPRRPTLTKAERDQSALSSEDLGRQFATVLARHG